MGSIASLEVVRSVDGLYGADDFFEAVSSIGRRVYDQPSNGLVMMRPSNQAYRTTKPGIRVFENLEYQHFVSLGPNVQRFGKKIVQLAEKLEEGVNRYSILPLRKQNELTADAGNEPLGDTLSKMSKVLLADELHDDGSISLGIYTIGVAVNSRRFPGRSVFYLSGEPSLSTAAQALTDMSGAVRIAAERHKVSKRVLESEDSVLVNKIPFAITTNTDNGDMQAFITSVEELLPFDVLLHKSVDINVRT